MDRPEVGKVFLVNTDGGVVCSAMYRTHPLLRERDLAHDGKLYRQTRQTANGEHVYIELESTSLPNTPFLDTFDFPDLPPVKEVQWGDAYGLIDEMSRGGSFSKLADLRSTLDALQLKQAQSPAPVDTVEVKP